MLHSSLPVADDPEMQSVRSLRALLALGVACLMFVVLVVMVAQAPSDPPVATQAPALLPSAEVAVLGA
jgi:hypothetical protein